jgi:hypothetical protein
MNSYTFVKKDGNWQLQYSNYTYKEGHEIDIDLTEGSESMLNLLSDGKDEVSLFFDKQPFADANEIELVQRCEPFLNGGIYRLREFEGKKLDYDMWISDVTQHVFGETPEKIYFKKNPWA